MVTASCNTCQDGRCTVIVTASCNTRQDGRRTVMVTASCNTRQDGLRTVMVTASCVKTVCVIFSLIGISPLLNLTYFGELRSVLKIKLRICSCESRNRNGLVRGSSSLSSTDGSSSSAPRIFYLGWGWEVTLKLYKIYVLV